LTITHFKGKKMTDKQDYFGLYYFMGMALDVQEKNGKLVAAVPYVPEGFEIVLEPIEGESFRMHGGPLDGEAAVFVRNDDGEVTAMRAGGFELVKVPGETAKDLLVTERLLAPEIEITPEKEVAFSTLLQSILEKADDGWINYDLPYPKYEFIYYVIARDLIIFHGSNHDDIETFAPVRKSVELRDETGRGNLQAVYGTHDGLWSMFFAIVDRPNLRGSIQNGVMYFHNQAGETLAVYNFSINQEQLSEKPWRQGTLYFLPRDTFVRLKMTENSYANEWASEQEVKPLAKLIIEPEDFPFLDRIGGHDDGELMRLGTLTKAIRESARSASLDEDKLTVALPADMEGLDEYIKLHNTYMPAAKITVTPSGDALILEIASLPPAYRQVLKDEYADLLID
jgi:hypothetical protein